MKTLNQVNHAVDQVKANQCQLVLKWYDTLSVEDQNEFYTLLHKFWTEKEQTTQEELERFEKFDVLFQGWLTQKKKNL